MVDETGVGPEGNWPNADRDNTPARGRELRYAVSANTKSKAHRHWNRRKFSNWASLVEKFQSLSHPEELPDDKYQAGGFVAGFLIDGPASSPCLEMPCDRKHKTKATVQSRSWVTLDYDMHNPGLPEKVRALGVSAVCHWTASATPDGQRWRVHLLTDRDLTPEEYAKVAYYATVRIGSDDAVEDWDPASWNPVWTMYFPASAVPDQFRWEVIDGGAVEVDDWLDDFDLLGLALPDTKKPRLAPEDRPVVDLTVPVTTGEREAAQRLLDRVLKAIRQADDKRYFTWWGKVKDRDNFGVPALMIYKFAAGGCIDWDAVDEAIESAATDADWDADVLEDRISNAHRMAKGDPWRPTVHDIEGFEGLVDAVAGVVDDGGLLDGFAADDKIRGVLSSRIEDTVLGDRRKARRLPPPDAPADVAQVFLNDHVGDSGFVEIRTWNETVYEWARTHWKPIDKASVLVELQSFTKDAVFKNPNPKAGGDLPWRPSAKSLSWLLSAVKQTAGAYLLPSARANTFLYSDGSAIDSAEDNVEVLSSAQLMARNRYLSFTNGIYDVVTGDRMNHTPRYFNTTSRPFAYDRAVGAPTKFLKALNDFWGREDDKGKATTAAFQEQFGFLLFGRNSDRLKTVVVWQGPGNCGKSVITDLLTALLGGGVVALDPHTFVKDFGMASLTKGAELGVFTEADFAGVGRQATGRIKAISGYDMINAGRKNIDDFVGKLEARMLMVTNAIPSLSDTSGAINNRVQATAWSREFSDEEQDDTLLDTWIDEELSEIAMWALTGYLRAIGAGHLTMSESGKALAAEIAGQSSPMASWIDERVVPEANALLTPADASEDYYRWLDDNGLSNAPTYSSTAGFSKAVAKVRPALVAKVVNVDGKNGRYYVGWKLAAVVAPLALIIDKSETGVAVPKSLSNRP